MLLALIAPALGQPAPADPEVSEEIVVTGEAVAKARAAVIAELTSLGYDRVVDKGDRVVLKHERTWKGKVVLFDDGYLAHRRQGVRVVDGPAVGLPKGTRWLPCILVPTGCLQSGLGVGSRKLDAERQRTLRAVEPRLLDLGDRLADAALARNLDLLPGRLDALWHGGAPLEPGAPLATFRARRSALLAFWESRTETEWGETMRQAVEAFARGVVQPSDHPFTDRELAQFDHRSSASRRFPIPE